MIYQKLAPIGKLSPFIKNIMVFENTESHAKTQLPFFADGFPGLMYHESPNGLYVLPHDKKMPELFIYGQTIEPIQIEVNGKFQIIIFQLFPFCLKHLFGIDPKSINDNCYDVTQQLIQDGSLNTSDLSKSKDYPIKINIISRYLTGLIDESRANFDQAIIEALNKIMLAKGKLSLTALAREVHLTKRTFERRFVSETGLTPKQFAKIIQFQNSLIQLSVNDYDVLTDIVYQNGFADQSHFIRVFKSFTGHTPKQFANQIPAN